MRRQFFYFLLLASSTLMAAGQDVLRETWAAHWIDVPGTEPQAYGVYHFRRTFDLPAKPARLLVYVSADNRYQLLVNGTRVSWGPARGDLTHWRYETVDLAPLLKPGRNVLAAVVWNDGPQRAIAQISNQTGFLLQAADEKYAVLNTDRRWRCLVDKAYAPEPWIEGRTGYFALSANERFDARLYPWGWQEASFRDDLWRAAREITRAAPRDARDAPNRWMLVPSAIPLEEQRPERFARVRQADGINPAGQFLQGHAPIAIPPHSVARLLIDQGYLTTAYPEFQIGGGRDARLRIRYAEALYDKQGDDQTWLKGNRNEVDGKQFLGPADTVIADGGKHRIYRPLFWRTYRYIELRVETSMEPIALEDVRGTFTAYPFERRGSFEVDDQAADGELQRILQTGWRTARLCAHETYMDCPFYEQLQYGGDARIQMLVSLYMTGDARLMKNGIALLNSSRTAEGATNSRAPSYLQQYIPPFSLWWIGMVHDYWMYVDDPGFVKEMMPGVRAVLDFYAQHQKENGSLLRMPWWKFVDWVKQWKEGEPPADPDGSSAAALDLQLLLAYRWAADLERALGRKTLSDEYAVAAATLAATVKALDWDSATGLFADQPTHHSFSQQVNTLAVLAHVVPEGRERSVMEKLTGSAQGSDAVQLAQSSIYFRAYTNAALREAGLGDRYVEALGPWRGMLGDGLTTWAEWNGPDSRSDCHAWGASPNFELLRTVAGIESMGPGFRAIRIAPHPGHFKRVSAQMPHPAGLIRVRLAHEGRLTADIELPSGTTGELDWNGSSQPLHAGKNHIVADEAPRQ